MIFSFFHSPFFNGRDTAGFSVFAPRRNYDTGLYTLWQMYSLFTSVSVAVIIIPVRIIGHFTRLLHPALHGKIALLRSRI